MKRCITNLLNNACSYGDKIIINLEKIEDSINITIEDDGPGIDEEDYERAIKPLLDWIHHEIKIYLDQV